MLAPWPAHLCCARSRASPVTMPGSACLDQERGAERAAEIAERGELDRGRVLVDEQVRLHRLRNALDVWLAQAQSQSAADDDGLDVKQIDSRCDARAERFDGAVDQLDGHLVVLLQRPRPDAGRQPRPPALLHDLEQIRLLALLLQLASARFHRRASGVGLHAALAAAWALRAVDLDDDVADLAGGAAATPLLAVQHQSAADTCTPEDAEDRMERLARAEPELGLGGHRDVVAQLDARSERRLELGTEREAALPVGQVARLRDRACSGVDRAGGADAYADQGCGLEARLQRGRGERTRDRVQHVLRATLRRRRHA